MNNNQRRSKTAINSSSRQNNRSSGITSALSRSASSSAVSQIGQSTSQVHDPLSNDPYTSISRAIQNVKFGAVSRLYNLSTAKYARSQQSVLHWTVRKAARFLLVSFLVFSFVTVITKQLLSSRRNISSWGSSHDLIQHNADIHSLSMRQLLTHRPTFAQKASFSSGPWVIGLVADLDKESCRSINRDKSLRMISCSKATAWVSFLMRGILTMPVLHNVKSPMSVEWIDEIELVSKAHSETGGSDPRQYGGRALELSELSWFNGHLLTPDDRTGMLMEILFPHGLLNKTVLGKFYDGMRGPAPSVLGKKHVTDGPGNDSTKHFKGEWMVVKGDQLYIGGHGKAFTDPSDGSKILSDNPKWVKVINRDLDILHVDWTRQYAALEKAAGVSFPGYLMHETALWSAERSEWVFLPRKRSKEAFDATANERKGWNTAIIACENFKKVRTVEIRGLEDESGLRGFSSAKFIPGSLDQLIIAVRTVEKDPSSENSSRETATFLSVIDLRSGAVILKEQNISDKKFEGIEFL